MARAGRNGRVRFNAVMSKMTRTETKPTCRKMSPNEWVVEVVKKSVGARAQDGVLSKEDIVGDVLLSLLDQGGFNWEEEEIVVFARKMARAMTMKHAFRVERHREGFGFDGDEQFAIELRQVTEPFQEISYRAKEAVGFLNAIPTNSRAVLKILCDGGNPIDIAEEFGVSPVAAITLIKEAREHINRVDPA
jgi:DNA-directed RNA polymerase specialized sigma24 family protein